jgi:MoaA/NifB/PqqE/SkfB family radical SAM enzyme
LTIGQWKTIFKDISLPSLKRITFSGTYGDPFMCKDVELITDYCINHFPDVTLDFSTNGSMRTKEFWTNFAKKKNVQIRFALDGLGDTHSIHRIGTDFEEVLANATTFIKSGGNAIWLMIRFDHNNHQIESARELSQKLGFSNFLVKENGKTLGWVFTNDTDGYWILPAKSKIDKNRLNRPAKFKPFSRISLDDFRKQEQKWIKADRQISCRSLNNKAIYIAGDGKVYPCCWLGQFPETYKYNNFKSVLGDVQNRADVIGLNESIKWFHKVEDSWRKKTIDSGMLMNCVGCAKDSFYQET